MSEAIPGLPEAPPSPVPAPASAVILWREGPAGRELFWVRRGRGLRFAGGYHAFPGGRLDRADGAVPVSGPRRRDAALVACAARELFEETGVLVARGAERLSRAEREEARHALLQRRLDFGAFLVRTGLEVDAAAFAPAGRWVTPAFLPIRFDASFFLVGLPRGEEAVVWQGELSGGEFVLASHALELWERGEVLLHPPNLWGIRCLARAAPPACLPALQGASQTGPEGRIELQKGVIDVALRTPTLPPATHTNCWVLDTGEGLAIVDPGTPDPAELAQLDELLDALSAEGLPPREIWLTHHHADHVGGVARLRSRRGLEVLAHPLTADRLPAGAGPVRPVEEGALLHGRFRVLHTPGHARGHLCFHDERSGTLLCGDMVSTLSTIVIDPPEGDMAEYLRQLERLRALAPRTLFPAHGWPAPNGVEKLDEYLAHRREREAKVVSALAVPGALSEVTRAAYGDTPAFMMPVAERSCLASLEKLRAEGRARLDGDRWSAA